MPVPAFVKDHLARPSLLIGCAIALSGGLSVGSYLKAGEMFPERPAPQVVVALAADPGAPIQYMTGADGRVPDYVLGTDHTYRPPELPLVRTAWEEPPGPEGIADAPPTAGDPARAPEPVAYTPPPSLGGDILAGVGAGEPTPVG